MRRRASLRQRVWWGAGVAAVLLMGISIGRLTVGAERPSAVAVGAPAPAPRAAHHVAATQHLSRVEVLLTTARTEAAAGSVDQQTVAWARELLSTTRLLLDSRAAADPELRLLLEDLEMVLAQIVQLPAGTAPEAVVEEELGLVKDAIERRDVLPRLRGAIPAGPPALTT
ncbi:MAG TPA: hypothetical protein VGR37_13455 [Longimicrobiaceae bacterium]|nr:hypothetical protein [Longimicrobiaceae bacterium]